MLQEKIYLVACGGHGRVILDSFLLKGKNIDGIIDPNFEKGTLIFNVPVVGDDIFLTDLNSFETLLINGFGISKNTNLRKEKFEDWARIGFKILGIIHPTAVVGAECSIAASAQIMAGVVLQNRTRIEDNAVINTRTSIDHDCSIGKHAFISPGVTICGGVVVREKSLVGAGAILLPGIEIGEGAIVGAGSVVTKDVEPRSLVVGNPAKKL